MGCRHPYRRGRALPAHGAGRLAHVEGLARHPVLALPGPGAVAVRHLPVQRRDVPHGVVQVRRLLVPVPVLPARDVVAAHRLQAQRRDLRRGVVGDRRRLARALPGPGVERVRRPVPARRDHGVPDGLAERHRQALRQRRGHD